MSELYTIKRIRNGHETLSNQWIGSIKKIKGVNGAVLDSNIEWTKVSSVELSAMKRALSVYWSCRLKIRNRIIAAEMGKSVEHYLVVQELKEGSRNSVNVGLLLLRLTLPRCNLLNRTRSLAAAA